jgi:hypothetical protein
MRKKGNVASTLRVVSSSEPLNVGQSKFLNMLYLEEFGLTRFDRRAVIGHDNVGALPGLFGLGWR